MGTMWSGGDISSRYQKSRVAAEQKASLQEAKRSAPTVVVQRPTADKVLQEKPSNRSNVSTESSESTNCHAPILKSIGRKRAASISQAGSLKNLRERVQARLLGRPSSVLGVDSEH